MEAEPLAILTAAAFGTSIVSAAIGLAGGTILLAIMLLFYDPLVVIPLHGAVQLVSNSSRVWFLREHIVRPIAWRYGALLVPGGLLGLSFVTQAPADVVRAMIGVFVLVATWAPGLLLLGVDPSHTDPHRRFLGLGFVLGAFTMAFGATGPLAAPFFLNLGLSRQALVGTQAACQALGHLTKIALFGAVGFAFSEWLVPLALLAGAVVAGTFVGTRMLHRTSDRMFVALFKIALTAIALRLTLAEVFEWLGGR